MAKDSRFTSKRDAWTAHRKMVRQLDKWLPAGRPGATQSGKMLVYRMKPWIKRMIATEQLTIEQAHQSVVDAGYGLSFKVFKQYVGLTDKEYQPTKWRPRGHSEASFDWSCIALVEELGRENVDLRIATRYDELKMGDVYSPVAELAVMRAMDEYAKERYALALSYAEPSPTSS